MGRRGRLAQGWPRMTAGGKGRGHRGGGDPGFSEVPPPLSHQLQRAAAAAGAADACRAQAAAAGEGGGGECAWELLNLPRQGAVCVEQDGAAALVLVQQAGVLEVLHQRRLALRGGRQAGEGGSKQRGGGRVEEMQVRGRWGPDRGLQQQSSGQAAPGSTSVRSRKSANSTHTAGPQDSQPSPPTHRTWMRPYAMWQIFSLLNFGHFLPCSSSTRGTMYSGRTCSRKGGGGGVSRGTERSQPPRSRHDSLSLPLTACLLPALLLPQLPQLPQFRALTILINAYPTLHLFLKSMGR